MFKLHRLGLQVRLGTRSYTVSAFVFWKSSPICLVRANCDNVLIQRKCISFRIAPSLNLLCLGVWRGDSVSRWTTIISGSLACTRMYGRHDIMTQGEINSPVCVTRSVRKLILHYTTGIASVVIRYCESSPEQLNRCVRIFVRNSDNNNHYDDVFSAKRQLFRFT